MKKLIALVFTAVAMSACATMGTTADGTATTSATRTAVYQANEKMQICMLNEATAMLTDGSIYNQNIRTSAKSISKICAQKLAIESLPEQYQAAAELVVNSVKAGKAAAAANKNN